MQSDIKTGTFLLLILRSRQQIERNIKFRSQNANQRSPYAQKTTHRLIFLSSRPYATGSQIFSSVAPCGPVFRNGRVPLHSRKRFSSSERPLWCRSLANSLMTSLRCLALFFTTRLNPFLHVPSGFFLPPCVLISLIAAKRLLFFEGWLFVWHTLKLTRVRTSRTIVFLPFCDNESLKWCFDLSLWLSVRWLKKHYLIINNISGLELSNYNI